MNPCFVIPAYDCAGRLGGVLSELGAALGPLAKSRIIVVDDGSRDAGIDVARAFGARVLSHASNRGKGAALLSGLALADREGFDTAVTVDADGQHPGTSAMHVLESSAPSGALVLGVRDLREAGAPPAHRFSNGISNFFLSRFVGRALHDTQCGLRRYPIPETLAAGAHASGYDFEAEILLLLAALGVPIVEMPIDVRYPEDRISHFDKVRDPARIIRTVLRTMAHLHLGQGRQALRAGAS